jgi:peroxiredoxin
MKRQACIGVMLVMSVVINIVLARKLNQFNRLLGSTKVESLKAGVTVPPLRVVDMEGQARTLKYDEVSTPTILYILSPSCSWCTRNMANFRELVAQRNSEYRFIAVSLSKEGLPEYVTKHKLMIPVYASPSIEMQRAYRLGGTPQTIVVSTHGRVLKDWEGAYADDLKAQVEQFFRVSLPGLQLIPVSASEEQLASGR